MPILPSLSPEIHELAEEISQLPNDAHQYYLNVVNRLNTLNPLKTA